MACLTTYYSTCRNAISTTYHVTGAPIDVLTPLRVSLISQEFYGGSVHVIPLPRPFYVLVTQSCSDQKQSGYIRSKSPNLTQHIRMYIIPNKYYQALLMTQKYICQNTLIKCNSNHNLITIILCTKFACSHVLYQTCIHYFS